MNRAALAQIGRHWQFVLDTLRDWTPPDASLHDAFRVTLYAATEPLRCSRPLPGRVAALYKACVGISQVFCWLMLQGPEMGDKALRELGSGQEFVGWLQATGWLFGQRQVCAGSALQIATIFDVLCGGTAAAAPDVREFLVAAGDEPWWRAAEHPLTAEQMSWLRR